ncbi:hypothetical protein [Actinomadura sp. NBRC 104425]|uniref:hypothetical protein n=1 Tax=Actinomadura sp. NBRC 104425 TaxID=3032204 RepID=UPI002553282F|nr:hypothetical protein [Actinomadura sp. NBRC 104425]
MRTTSTRSVRSSTTTPTGVASRWPRTGGPSPGRHDSSPAASTTSCPADDSSASSRSVRYQCRSASQPSNSSSTAGGVSGMNGTLNSTSPGPASVST